jgi:hypothetical protein
MNGGGAPFCQRAAAPAHEDVLAQDAVRVLAVERLFPRASVPLCPWWTSRSAVALVGSPNSWRPRDMGRAARSLATQHAAVPLAGPPRRSDLSRRGLRHRKHGHTALRVAGYVPRQPARDGGVEQWRQGRGGGCVPGPAAAEYALCSDAGRCGPCCGSRVCPCNRAVRERHGTRVAAPLLPAPPPRGVAPGQVTDQRSVAR